MSLMATLVLSMSLIAQQKTEVTIKIKEDGKVIKDTTYQFEDADEARHALKMMEILSGDEKHGMHYNYTTAHAGGGESKAMIFISEDGKTTEIKKYHGDSLVWVSEGEHGEVHSHGEHVVVVKSGDGETFDVIIKEGSDELHEVNENVFIIKEDGEDIDLEKIMEEHGEGENVKVIIIKKEEKK